MNIEKHEAKMLIYRHAEWLMKALELAERYGGLQGTELVPGSLNDILAVITRMNELKEKLK